MTQQRHKHYQCIRAFSDGWKIVDICGVVLTNPSFYDYEEYFTVPDSEGWLPWYATEDGVCPVDGDVVVEYEVRQGKTYMRKAGQLDWRNITMSPITRYRIVEEHKTPRAKPKKVRYLAYVTGSGELRHYEESRGIIEDGLWKRVPSLDLEVEE